MPAETTQGNAKRRQEINNIEVIRFMTYDFGSNINTILANQS
jgi:hypothetical protein